MIKNLRTAQLIFLGAPGVGKGTLAALLAQEYQLVHISSGEIFRAEVAAKTPLGLSIKAALEAGAYMPDDITNAVVLKAINAARAQHRGFILDGYPRTLNQAQFLETSGIVIDLVAVLTAPPSVLVARLLARGRADDTEATIKRRLEIYDSATRPLINYYEQRHLTQEVHSRGAIDESYHALVVALGAHD